MTIAACLVLAAGALLMTALCRMSRRVSRICDGLAAVSFFMMFSIISAAVVRTILNDTVFMTEVHSILLNPFLLSSGAFIGVYTLFKMIETALFKRS